MYSMENKETKNNYNTQTNLWLQKRRQDIVTTRAYRPIKKPVVKTLNKGRGLNDVNVL
jgi:hypothetical protein